MHKLELDLTLQLVVSGEATTRRPTTMCASLTHSLLPTGIHKMELDTGMTSYLSATGNMNTSKTESISKGLERWNMPLSSRWSLQQQVEWPMRQHTSTTGWLRSLQENGTIRTVPLGLGYVVLWFFPCYTWPFNASGEFGPVLVMLVSHHLQLTCMVIPESSLDNAWIETIHIIISVILFFLQLIEKK